MSFSAFGSKDGYSYRYGGDSDESMGWDNLIVASPRFFAYYRERIAFYAPL